jgi:hypothetical protein
MQNIGIVKITPVDLLKFLGLPEDTQVRDIKIGYSHWDAGRRTAYRSVDVMVETDIMPSVGEGAIVPYVELEIETQENGERKVLRANPIPDY